MSTVLADYKSEREAFKALFQPDCDERILLYRGSSGSGKTTLLRYCSEQIPPEITNIPIQLRGRAVSTAEIFYRAGRVLAWERLSKFTRQVALFEGTPSVQIDSNWMAGINNRIQVALHVENLVDREERLASLTEAWFDDVGAFQQPSLFLFDTFEQATTEVKDWISGPFLARVAYAPSVRVVVAGQEVPEENNIEWGHCCVAHDLYGVIEAKHWMPVVQAMGRHIDVESPETWLAGVCHAFNGDPARIMNVIKGLPKKTRLT